MSGTTRSVGLTAALVTATTAAAHVWHVDAAAQPGGDGAGWATALQHLQDALTHPELAVGDEIWVAEGTYFTDRSETDPNGTDDPFAQFELVNGVGLYGGFPTGGGDGAFTARDPVRFVTTLSGDLFDEAAVTFDPCTTPAGEGGHCFIATPTTTGCRDPRCCNVVCEEVPFCCVTGWDTLCTQVASDLCRRSYHVVEAVGVNDTARIDGFTITAGLARGELFWETVGGGMLVRLGAPEIVRCTFAGNGAAFRGGGLYFSGFTADSQVTSCSFFENHAASGGAIGIEDGGPRMVNCVFSANSAETGDGGAILADGSNASLYHCTVAGNRAGAFASGTGGASSGLTLVFNSIAWGNSPDEIVDASVVGYSLVAGGHAGLGNFDGDPRFVDLEAGDLRLTHGSAAIARASFSLLPDDATDLDGDLNVGEPVPLDRVNAGRVIDFLADVGAFEFCRHDLDGDGQAATTDLLLVLGHWGEPADGPPDVDGDGLVGVLDFLAIIGHWGDCG